MRAGPDADQSTSTGHKLGTGSHLDRHYLALQTEYEETLRSAGLQTAWKVLDAGSGNGVFLPLMSRILGACGHITALDLATENCEAIRSKSQLGLFKCCVEARVGDIAMLPFPDGQFDALWSANVVQYLSDKQLSQAMGEFSRVVRAGGLVAIKEVDITVWQFQPQDPKLMWRLLESLSGDTQISGAMRGTRVPLWFREAGLTEITSKTTLAERRQPLAPVERSYIGGNLKFLASQAKGQNLSEGDSQAWYAIGERPEMLLDHPDFCYRELYCLTLGHVPKDARLTLKCSRPFNRSHPNPCD